MNQSYTVCSNAESDSSFSMEVFFQVISLFLSSSYCGCAFSTFKYLALLVRVLSPKELQKDFNVEKPDLWPCVYTDLDFPA